MPDESHLHPWCQTILTEKVPRKMSNSQSKITKQVRKQTPRVKASRYNEQTHESMLRLQKLKFQTQNTKYTHLKFQKEL